MQHDPTSVHHGLHIDHALLTSLAVVVPASAVIADLAARVFSGVLITIATHLALRLMDKLLGKRPAPPPPPASPGS